MIAAGQLEASRVGGRWVVDRSSVERRRRATILSGRPFSARRSWGLLWLASGQRPAWLKPSDISRLRRRLRQQRLIHLAPRLQKRATRRFFRAHPSDLDRIERESQVVPTGLSAVGEFDLDLAPEPDCLEFYTPAAALDVLKTTYALQPGLRPNLLARVVEPIWPFDASAAQAPAVVVGLDLFESDDPRLQRAGRELLEELP